MNATEGSDGAWAGSASDRVFFASAAALVLVGAGLRVAMAFESFWLDEAWSYFLALGLESPWQVVTELRHDNNHILNTLYLRALGPDAAPLAYRALSLATGIAFLPLLAVFARRWGRSVALLALALVAVSAPLVSASAQARGYAPSLLLGLVYVMATGARSGGRRGAARLALLWLSGVLGFLSHGTFVYPLLAALAWSIAHDLRAGSKPAAMLKETAIVHGPAIALAAFLYVVFYSQLSVGGGPDYEREAVVRQALASSMGLPRRGLLTWLASGVALVLVGGALWQLRNAADRIGVFFATVVLLAPALVVGLSDPKVFYARYLLACLPWLYLLVAISLVASWRPARWTRAAALALGALFLLPSVARNVSILSVGRGDYERALAFMDRRSPSGTIEVGSDHDLRNETVLRFYARRLPAGRRLRYYRAGEWPDRGPEWYLRHSWRAGRDPEPTVSPAPGLVYERVDIFEHGPGDGFTWSLYRASRSDGR